MLKEIIYGLLEEVKEYCDKNNVNIVNKDGSYKTVYEVLGELSQKVWNQDTIK